MEYTFAQKLESIAQEIEACGAGESFDTELIEACGDAVDAIRRMLTRLDLDPSPDHLWDHTGGEPPLSADERWQAAHQQHLELHS